MDFADPPLPVDGIFGKILSVRDLGSGKALLWLPMERKTGTEVRAALLALFLEHGAPLVLKSDNDSAFKPEEVGSLLKAWGVTTLLSPCHYPRYNGACESGIGTMKTYSHHEAARNDRPGEWSSDDLEAARRRANEHTRPRGHLGPTPEELWCSRDQILADEREAFQERLQRNRNEAANRLRDEKRAELDRRDQAAVERDAITATLVESGMLQIRRRRISSPNKFRKLSRIMR